MNPHLVSIVTPAYKAAKFVGQAIESVQVQAYADWEMLIVDDGSPDNTAEVVAAYSAADPRIHLLRQANAGPAMARQAGLEKAQGRYIAFLDSDDWWLPGKLERQIAFMREKDAAVSYTSFRRTGADGEQPGHRIVIPPSLTYRQLLRNTAMATSTVIIDREKAGALHMTRAYYDDFVLWLDVLKRGHRAWGLDEDLMRYRVVSQSVSRNKLKSVREVWKTYREIEKLGMLSAAWCFAGYGYHALQKYRKY